MQVLAYLDASITRAAATAISHNPLTFALFSFVSRAGGSFVIWLAILALLVVLKRKKDYLILLSFSLSSLVTAVLVNYLIKNMFMRPRPYVAWSISTLCPSDYSFPSGHAAFSFGAAAILSYYDRKRAPGYYMAAVLISYSRLFLYCHYLSDVIVGAIIGYGISRLVLFFQQHYIPKPGSLKRKMVIKAKKE